jgi:osmoprotectant transport system permease protein
VSRTLLGHLLATVAVVAVVSVVATGLAAPLARADAAPVTVGSKAFAESWILGEAVALLAEPFASVEHRRNLGGTEIVFEAVRRGSIDVYAEYTGTIAEVILHATDRPPLAVMRERLAPLGIGMSDPLGFNDGYALAVTRTTAQRYGLRTISDLARRPELRAGLSHEFLGRNDGYPGLADHYGLAMKDVRGVQHELAYEAIASGQIDVMDIYTTDAQIGRLGLVLLDDDRDFFRRYDAVLLYRLDLPQRVPHAFAAMMRLVGSVDEARMMRANARVLLDHKSATEAAAMLLTEALGTGATAAHTARGAVAASIAENTLRHVELVAVSLALSMLLGLPLGILASRSRRLATLTLAGAGLLQTIPSLALLAFLIPLFGIGLVPALVALFLYGLLPIVQSTYTGLRGIPPALAEAAEALGLPPGAQLWRVALPMASPSILAGIRTSAVINVGTATIAALIGAEGLGNPIMEGIALRDTSRILEGAVPAALLALAVQGLFAWVERFVVPRGLRAGAPGEDPAE